MIMAFRYVGLVAEWMAAREAAGGQLSEDAESDWTARVDEVWRTMSVAEQEAAEKALAALAGEER